MVEKLLLTITPATPPLLHHVDLPLLRGDDVASQSLHLLVLFALECGSCDIDSPLIVRNHVFDEYSIELISRLPFKYCRHVIHHVHHEMRGKK